jgi:hypothetical protein
LLDRTLARTISGEIRTQDAPFLVSAILGHVYARELAWAFVKTNWEKMDQLFPKQGLRRMCGGIAAWPHLNSNEMCGSSSPRARSIWARKPWNNIWSIYGLW